MSPREHDPELRDLISAGDTLHEQLTRLDRSEPPEELDRIIIERARQAIRTPQSERPIRQVRWAVPLGLAATLLISFGLVFHQVNTQQPATPPPTAATQERQADVYAPVAAQRRMENAPSDQAVEERLKATAKAQSSKAPLPRVTANSAPAEVEKFESVTVAGASAMEGSASESDAMARATEPAVKALADAEAKADFRSDPDAWRAYIARLAHAGRSEEANRELAEFRRVYPKLDYAAPAGAPAARPAEAIAPEK